MWSMSTETHLKKSNYLAVSLSGLLYLNSRTRSEEGNDFARTPSLIRRIFSLQKLRNHIKKILLHDFIFMVLFLFVVLP